MQSVFPSILLSSNNCKPLSPVNVSSLVLHLVGETRQREEMADHLPASTAQPIIANQAGKMQLTKTAQAI